jgi:hypothetical protein
MNDSPGEADPRVKVIYEEAVRGWSLQSSVLDELRGRTGVLLAAASVAAALLGSADLTKHESLGSLGVIALVVFGLVVALCLCVLWPFGGWIFSHDADKALKAYVGQDFTLDETLEGLARKADEYRGGNDKKLAIQFWAFRLAALGLGVSIILWIIDLD